VANPVTGGLCSEFVETYQRGLMTPPGNLQQSGGNLEAKSLVFLKESAEIPRLINNASVSFIACAEEG